MLLGEFGVPLLFVAFQEFQKPVNGSNCALTKFLMFERFLMFYVKTKQLANFRH